MTTSSAPITGSPCRNWQLSEFLRSTAKTGLFSGLLCAASLALASPDEPSALRLSGFGTLGAVRTNNADAQYVRDLYEPDGAKRRWTGKVDSVLGVQADYRFSEHVSGVVQAVSRYRYDHGFGPEISWAFLKYSPNSQFDLRLGRVGTDFFMLADSRLVGYSYLTVRPVGDYFWHLPFYSIDGGDIAWSMPAGTGVVRLKAFAGGSHERLALEDQVWKLNGSMMTGAYAEYLDGPWHLRASYASIRFKSDLPVGTLLAPYQGVIDTAAAQRYLSMNGRRTDYYALGAVFDSGPWQAQLMLNAIDQGNEAFQDSVSGYGLLGYRIGSVTPFAGYSRAHSKDAPTVPGNPLYSAVVAGVISGTHVNQHTGTLGVRWDVATDIALKLQLDAIRGSAGSVLPYRWENSQWNGRMNVISATMDFIF